MSVNWDAPFWEKIGLPVLDPVKANSIECPSRQKVVDLLLGSAERFNGKLKRSGRELDRELGNTLG
jgi:hypothetical protein